MDSSKPGGFRAIPSATGGIARLACARLLEQGKDVAAVLSKTGLTRREAEDPAIRLEVRTQIKFLELAAEALGDDLLGFHLARSFDLREIGLIYYVMASSERLDDALGDAARYSGINNEGVRLRFAENDAAMIALDYVNVDRSSDRHQAEFWLVALVRICRHVTDGRFAPLRLRMRHFRDGTPAEFKSFFGCDVEFAAEADEITLPTNVASLPVVSRDSYLHNLLHRYAEEALAKRPPQRAGLRADIEKILTLLLPHGRAEASEAARRLGMSARTLSRKLRDQGLTYAGVLDDFRASLAKHYLSEGDLSVSEIAWLLGYREFSSLTHAFKRWTGMTPRQFRLSGDAHQNGAGSPSAKTAAGKTQEERGGGK
jgi:AraC-like DNA-binding protein